MAQNEKSGNEKDIFQDWLKAQEQFLDTWKESVTAFQPESVKNTFGEPFEKMLEEWKNNQEKVLELWKGTFSDFQPQNMLNLMSGGDATKQMKDFYKNWYENAQKMFQEMTKMFPTEIGKDTFEKMFQSGNVYSSLFDFWNKYISDFLQRPGASFPGRLDEMPKEWMEEYNKVLQQFFQQGFGDAFGDYISRTTELADSYRQTMESFLSPWFDSSEDLREKAMEAMRGDSDAYMQFLRKWNEAYQDSFGRLFRAPGFGLTKETSERMLQSMEAYVEYTNALNEFTTALYGVGHNVMERLMNKLQELKDEGNPPETFKEFYDLWVEANENAYLELFKEDSFARLLGRVVDSGAKFKKRYDNLMMEALDNLPIPTDKDMDTVYQNMYELKKEVRYQRREIDELKKRLDEK